MKGIVDQETKLRIMYVYLSTQHHLHLLLELVLMTNLMERSPKVL